MNSCVYRGAVRHRRYGPVQHRFSYPLFMMYLDLDELPTLFDGRWLWSARAPALAWFRRADYLGDRDVGLSTAVRAEAERLTGLRPEGPIRMLTHLRYFGFVMNPVTFYYCFRSEGGGLDTVLAEITNTPWGERHTYAVRTDPEARERGKGTHRFDKSFHISPFMGMDQEYVWRLTDPGRRLLVHMTNRERGRSVFDATLLMRREEISGRTLARVLTRYQSMTARVAGGIYWQAFRLWLKRTPFFAHPETHAA